VRHAWLALPFAFAFSWSACGAANPGGSPTAPTTNATPAPTPVAATTSMLTVSVKDSPFSDAKALLITFSDVSAHLTGADFIPLPFSGTVSSRTCDLKKLTTAQDILGVGPLPVGHYTQLRLVVASATIYFDNPSSGPACAASMAVPEGRSAAVDIPSGEVKLNREFDLTSTTATTILVDFDGDKSVNQTGNGRYMMTPVIAVVSVTSTVASSIR
jgi:Domain of unknown function (DUF4382)